MNSVNVHDNAATAEDRHGSRRRRIMMMEQDHHHHPPLSLSSLSITT
jgi:hypothetical protein